MDQHFKEKLKELYLRDAARAIPGCDPFPMPGVKAPKTIPKLTQEPFKTLPRLRYYCDSPAKHLGHIEISLMRFLLIIRDDAKIFQHIGEAIDKSANLDEAKRDLISDDIVFFLLADFTSPETYAINCLSQFKPLIDVHSSII